MKTMKVKPWGKNQGEYVLINEDDFDPNRHTPYGQAERPANPAATSRKKRKKKTG